MSDYRGWIPNVAGRLSFSLIGKGCQWTSRCRTVNAGIQRRQVLCAQKRILTDTLLWPPYFSFLFDAVTDFYFLLDAQNHGLKRNGADSLVGRVYVFTTDAWKNKITVPSHVHPIAPEEAFNAACFPYEEFETVDRVSQFQSACQKLRDLDILAAACLYAVDIEIHRSGVVDLSGIAIVDVDYAQSVMKESEEITDSEESILYNQVFYFLKDIAHSHKHHDKGHDTITYATKRDSEAAWAREAQYSMHRAVLSHRRSGDVSRLNNALGIMAYMSSLDTILRTEIKVGTFGRRIPSGVKLALDYNLKDTEASIRAEAENAKARADTRKAGAAALIAVPFALVSFFKGDDLHNVFQQGFAISDKLLSDFWMALTICASYAVFIAGTYWGNRLSEIKWLRNTHHLYRAMTRGQGNFFLWLFAFIPFLDLGILKFLFHIDPFASEHAFIICFWTIIGFYLFSLYVYVPFYFTAWQLAKRLASFVFPNLKLTPGSKFIRP